MSDQWMNEGGNKFRCDIRAWPPAVSQLCRAQGLVSQDLLGASAYEFSPVQSGAGGSGGGWGGVGNEALTHRNTNRGL